MSDSPCQTNFAVGERLVVTWPQGLACSSGAVAVGTEVTVIDVTPANPAWGGQQVRTRTDEGHDLYWCPTCWQDTPCFERAAPGDFAHLMGALFR